MLGISVLKTGIFGLILFFAISPLIWSYYIFDLSVFLAIVWGMGICSGIMTAGFIMLIFTIGKSINSFLSALIGGILIRLITVLVTGFYVMNYTSLPIKTFFITIIIYYFFWQLVEICYLRYREKAKKNIP